MANHSVHWITRLGYPANVGLRGDVVWLCLANFRATELDPLVSGRPACNARCFAFDQSRSNTSARSDESASTASPKRSAVDAQGCHHDRA
jgi:hypothetical protein